MGTSGSGHSEVKWVRGRHDQQGPALTLVAMQQGDGKMSRGRRLNSSSTEAGPDAPGLPDWPGSAGKEERHPAPQTGSVPMVATMIRREGTLSSLTKLKQRVPQS